MSQNQHTLFLAENDTVGMYVCRVTQLETNLKFFNGSSSYRAIKFLRLTKSVTYNGVDDARTGQHLCFYNGVTVGNSYTHYSRGS